MLLLKYSKFLKFKDFTFSKISNINKNFSILKISNKSHSTNNSFVKDSKYIDTKDDEFFKTIKDWWNPEGSMKTLHYFNDLRVEYILNSLKNNNSVKENNQNKLLPLENIKILDVGCGAGILSEVIYFY